MWPGPSRGAGVWGGRGGAGCGLSVGAATGQRMQVHPGAGKAGVEPPGPPGGWLHNRSLCDPSRLRPEQSDDKCVSICLALTTGYPPLRVQQETATFILDAEVTACSAALLAHKRPPLTVSSFPDPIEGAPPHDLLQIQLPPKDPRPNLTTCKRTRPSPHGALLGHQVWWRVSTARKSKLLSPEVKLTSYSSNYTD